LVHESGEVLLDFRDSFLLLVVEVSMLSEQLVVLLLLLLIASLGGLCLVVVVIDQFFKDVVSFFGGSDVGLVVDTKFNAFLLQLLDIYFMPLLVLCIHGLVEQTVE
jgi:hypothetical protein